MAHKLGSRFHVPHGLANAALISHVIRYNATDRPMKQAAFPQYQYPQAVQRYAELADVLGLGGDSPQDKVIRLIEAVEGLKAQCGVPVREGREKGGGGVARAGQGRAGWEERGSRRVGLLITWSSVAPCSNEKRSVGSAGACQSPMQCLCISPLIQPSEILPPPPPPPLLLLQPTIREIVGADKEAEYMAALDDMAENAFDDQCTGANPRYPLITDLKRILKEAWAAPILPLKSLEW